MVPAATAQQPERRHRHQHPRQQAVSPRLRQQIKSGNEHETSCIEKQSTGPCGSDWDLSLIGGVRRISSTQHDFVNSNNNVARYAVTACFDNDPNDEHAIDAVGYDS
jgi:hypothetical protein